MADRIELTGDVGDVSHDYSGVLEAAICTERGDFWLNVNEQEADMLKGRRVRITIEVIE